MFFLVVIDYAAAFTHLPVLHAFLLPLFVVSTCCCSQLHRQRPIITLFVLPVWYFMISLLESRKACERSSPRKMSFSRSKYLLYSNQPLLEPEPERAEPQCSVGGLPLDQAHLIISS
jgi:hypothetical protein